MLPDRLYHLAVQAEWQRALAGGEPYRRSTIDTSLEEEGFIHCSFAPQVQATADKYYRDRPDVVLLEIDPALLDCEVRVEHGFPHIYGPMNVDAVVWAVPVPLAADGRLATGPLVQP